MLAGLAALRVGAGVLALAVAEPVAASVAVAVPEASVDRAGRARRRPRRRGRRRCVGSADTVLVGPGLDAPGARPSSCCVDVLDGADDDATLVLDAFALGVLPGTSTPTAVAGRCVLTPNSTEAARLLDGRRRRRPRPARRRGRDRRRATGAVVSFQSQSPTPDGRRWMVPTGHAGLGTSGSGDVLAGAVTGLLARGADPAQAACWATYLHATAGDRLRRPRRSARLPGPRTRRRAAAGPRRDRGLSGLAWFAHRCPAGV